jgi:hypothetical protein
MVVLGVVLLVLGFVLSVPILWIVGLVLVVLGLIANVGYGPHRGGRYYY